MTQQKAPKARRSEAQGEGARAACTGTLGLEWDWVKPCKGEAGFEISTSQHKIVLRS
jgi:hypothetical protein